MTVLIVVVSVGLYPYNGVSVSQQVYTSVAACQTARKITLSLMPAKAIFKAECVLQ